MRILRILFWSLALLPIVALGLFLLATETAPTPGLDYPLSRADIDRAERLLRSHDPRHQAPGTVRHLLLRQRDLNVALNYLLSRTGRGSAQIELRRGQMKARLSLHLPEALGGHWLNPQLSLREGDPLPRIEALHIGALDIPAFLIPAVNRLLETLLRTDERSAALIAMIQQIRFIDKRLYARYRWDPQRLDAVRTSLLGSLNQESLDYYYTALNETTRRFTRGARVPLQRLLAPLFAAAQRRSTWRDPVEENRALLAVLAAWIGERGMSSLISDFGSKPRPRRLRPTLRGRHDLAQHLLISAALTVGSDTSVAEAIGLYKEIRDSWRGSGFSFTDLAADIAGARFGEHATSSTDSARDIQRRLASGVAEDKLLPSIDDLPEHLSAQDFSRRFKDEKSSQYQQLIETIEKRLNHSPLLKKE